MREPSREVVVTGVGVCCHLGDDLEAILDDLKAGRSTPFPFYQEGAEAGARCQLAGAYHGDLSNQALGIDKTESRFMGRAALLALKATRRALAQSQLARRDLAVVVGAGTGDVATHRDIQAKLDQKSARRVAPTVIPRLMASTVSANLVNVLRTTGPSFSAAAACAGGAYNLLLAAQLIETGHVDGAIAGGVEVIDIHFHVGFDGMRAYNTQDNNHPERASRPYAKDRAGFIFGEGAGILVLESRGAAEARGATILGAIKGYGMSSDGAGDMVAPSSEGAEAAMRRALANAGITPEDVDYINTHGTSTPLGDVSEVQAIRRLLGDRHVPYSSTKGYTGHSISAAGAIEAIFTLEMVRRGFIAPSVNAEPLEPELAAYPPLLLPTERPLRFALSNSFGFGGTNASLVIGRP